MKVHGDELDHDLFNEVENGPDKDGNDDFVDSPLPVASTTTVHMVVDHGWKERDLDTKPPEEKRRWELQLLCHVSPFLRVVCEDTGENANGRGYAFGDNLVSGRGC